MSKSSTRLSLKSETLRSLSGAALDAVVGGNKTGDIGPPTRTRTTLPTNSSCFGCHTQTGAR